MGLLLAWEGGVGIGPEDAANGEPMIHAMRVAMAHGLLWLVGQGGILFSARRVRREHHRQALAAHVAGQRARSLDEAHARLAEAQRELEEATARAEAVDEDLEEFLHRASHDLAAPVRNVVSFCGLLVDDLGDDLPPSAEKDLAFITEAALRVNGLVEALLALSRANRVVPASDDVPLDRCARKAVANLHSEIASAGAEVRVPSLPEVVGDENLLEDTFEHLLANALKFRGPRAPEIEFTAERHGDTWRVGVRDNGIGLDPAEEQKIFAPFGRLHGTSAYPGVGIGLAICRCLVEHQGGRLWVEAAPEQGAHFRFSLPVVARDAVNPGDCDAARPVPCRAGGSRMREGRA